MRAELLAPKKASLKQGRLETLEIPVALNCVGTG